MLKSLTSAGFAAALLLAVPGAVQATTIPDGPTPGPTIVDDTPDPIATVSTTTRLNVPGTGITLGLVLDPTGRLAAVTLQEPSEPDAVGEPTGGGGFLEGAEAEHVSGHKVRIVLSESGTVEVQAGGNRVDTRIRTSDLTDLAGTHTWSGELFGPGNGVTTVTVTVTADGGVPEILGVQVTSDSEWQDRVWTETDDDGYDTKLRVDLTDGTNKARVVVSVSMELDEDDGPSARLKISAHSRLLATERPGGPADDPDVEIGDDEVGSDDEVNDDETDDDVDDDDADDDVDDDDADDDTDRRGRNEDKRRNDGDRADHERGGRSDAKRQGQGGADHDDDSRDHSDDGPNHDSDH